MQDQRSQSEHLSSGVIGREQRDAQRAMDHWRRNTWAGGGVPLLDTFDFSPMKGDWGCRFLIWRRHFRKRDVRHLWFGARTAPRVTRQARDYVAVHRQDPGKIYRPVFLIAERSLKERPSISRARSVPAPHSNYTGQFLCRSCCSRTGRSSWSLEHSTAR